MDDVDFVRISVGWVVTDERATITADHLIDGAIKLSHGRKKHVLVRPD